MTIGQTVLLGCLVWFALMVGSAALAGFWSAPEDIIEDGESHPLLDARD